MIPRRLALLGGLGAGLSALPATSALAVDPRRRPPPERTSQAVPISVVRGLPWTTAQFDGGRIWPFGLNLGNPNLWCHPSVAEAAGYRISKDDQTRIVVKQVTVGKWMEDAQVPCFVSRQYFEGLPFSGQVGMARHDPLILDWDARQLVVNAATPVGWTEADVVQGAENVGPVVEVMIDGEPAEMILSTTRAWGLELAAPYVRRRGLWDRYARRRNDVDADGRVIHQMAVLDRVSLAGMRFEKVFARLYADDTVYRYDKHAADGLIGYDLLRRMNIYVDRTRLASRNLRTLLKPSNQPDQPQLDDRAGMVFEAFGNELQVARLDETAAAYKAGVRVGDTVIDAEVDGRTEGLAYALTRPAGTEVPIDILRGEKRMRITVILEDRL